jgi:hypothetical protein
MKKYIATSLLALGLAAPVMAANPPVNIYAVGSTACRTDVYATFCRLFPACTTNVTYNGYHGGSMFTFQGVWPADGSALAGQTVNFYYDGSGSASGQTAVQAGTSTTFLDLADNNTFSAVPNVAFSDVYQDSTSVSGHLNDTQIGVITFTFIGNAPAITAGISNVTAQNFADVYTTGTGQLSFFTGNPLDAGTPVYGSGRNDGSGTRITVLAETGFGIFNIIAQYGNGVQTGGVGAVARGANQNFWTAMGVGDGYGEGWNSGSGVGGDIGNPLITTPGIGYVGYNDRQGTLLTYNGYPLTAANVQNGKYTLWGYEHIMTTGLDPSGTHFASSFGKQFDITIQPGDNFNLCDGYAYAPGLATMPKSAMNVVIGDDGAQVQP